MTNREWLLNQPKEQIITNMAKPCPHHHCPDFKSCTECWIDWFDEEHKEPNEPEN